MLCLKGLFQKKSKLGVEPNLSGGTCVYTFLNPLPPGEFLDLLHDSKKFERKQASTCQKFEKLCDAP